jgi:hypothetical protein
MLTTVNRPGLDQPIGVAATNDRVIGSVGPVATHPPRIGGVGSAACPITTA